MRKLDEIFGIGRIQREFIASMHVRNVIRAKEKLEELSILAPLTEYRTPEKHFEIWADVMCRSAIELPEVTDYGLGLFDQWAGIFEDAIEPSYTVLRGIASIVAETKSNLLEYHHADVAEEVIKHLNSVSDRYAGIAKENKMEDCEKFFSRISRAKSIKELNRGIVPEK